MVAYRNGLSIPPGLPREEWLKIGSTLSGLVGSSMWLLGDWLAYGQSSYHGLPGHERVQDEIYPKLARETGFAESTLRDAKWVCSKVNRSGRPDELTFYHAREIVGRANPGHYSFWISKATEVGEDGRMPTVKQLREELRKSTATHKPEPNDVGVTTDIEWLRQIERDFLGKVKEWNPAMKREVLKILKTMADAVG